MDDGARPQTLLAAVHVLCHMGVLHPRRLPLATARHIEALGRRTPEIARQVESPQHNQYRSIHASRRAVHDLT